MTFSSSFELTSCSIQQTRRPAPRSRANTLRSTTYDAVEEPPPPPPEVRPSIKSRVPSGRVADIMSAELSDRPSSRPSYNRSTTFDAPAQTRRDFSPIGSRPLSRVPSDSLMVRTARLNLRGNERGQEQDVFADDSTFYTNSSPDQSYGDSVSPATSHGSGSATPLTKRAPPPPPPSRAKKPAPPPVPQKRTVYT